MTVALLLLLFPVRLAASVYIPKVKSKRSSRHRYADAEQRASSTDTPIINNTVFKGFGLGTPLDYIGLSEDVRCAIYFDDSIVPSTAVTTVDGNRMGLVLDRLLQYVAAMPKRGFLIDVIFLPDVAAAFQAAGVCIAKECLLNRAPMMTEGRVTKRADKLDVLFPSEAFNYDAAMKTYAAAISLGQSAVPMRPGLSSQCSVYVCMEPCVQHSPVASSPDGKQPLSHEAKDDARSSTHAGIAKDAALLSTFFMLVPATQAHRLSYVSQRNHVSAFEHMVKKGLRIPLIRNLAPIPPKDISQCRETPTIDISPESIVLHRAATTTTTTHGTTKPGITADVGDESTIRIAVTRFQMIKQWEAILTDLRFSLNSVCPVHQACGVYIVVEGQVDEAIMSGFVTQLPINIDITIVNSAEDGVISTIIMNADLLWSVSGADKSPDTFFDPIVFEGDVLQAMYCNVPVIAIDVGSNSEIIPPFIVKASVIAKAKQSLVVDSVRKFGELSLLLTTSDAKQLAHYSARLHGVASDFTLRELKGRFLKLFMRHRLHARYTKFALDRIGALRSQELSIANPSPAAIASTSATTSAATSTSTSTSTAGTTNTGYLALTVEPWLHPTLEFAVRNVMSHLGNKWALQIVHSQHNAELLRTMFSGVKHVQYVAMTDISDTYTDMWSAEDYSELLKSEKFWTRLQSSGYEHVLIFQSDSLMLHGRIDPFLSYDYIGAPWCGYSAFVARLQQTEHVLHNGIGNGGFSLRRVEAMLTAIRAPGVFRGSKRLSEDLFFASYLDTPANSNRFPNRSTGFAFAVEVQCSQEPRSLASPANVPLGIHAAWLFSGSQYTESLYEIMNTHYIV